MAAQAASIQSYSRRASTQAGRTPLPRFSSAQLAEKQPQGAETLFSHSSVKIVSFSAPGPQRQSSAPSVLSNGGSGSPGQTSGTLPWKSRNERVISVGPLRLYRVPGSVAFLHSGTLLLSLLPRSQCWCVDGQSKFALRNQEMIYRIELPYEIDGEKAKVEELKEVLKEVIQYEKTACPFKRGFQVELPEEPDSPLRRVLVAPAAKGQHWEHDDTWKPETDSKQVKEAPSSKPETLEGKTDASSNSEIQILTPKSSQEYILEAKPENGQDLNPSSKEPSIRALAGFVSSEASRISKTVSSHKTHTSDVQGHGTIVDDTKTKNDNKDEASPVASIGRVGYTSPQIDKTPLEPVSKTAQNIEESHAASPGSTVPAPLPPQSPTNPVSTETPLSESIDAATTTQLMAEPDTVLEEAIDRVSPVSSSSSNEEISKHATSLEENLTQTPPILPSTPTRSRPGPQPHPHIEANGDTSTLTATPTSLMNETEMLLSETEVPDESAPKSSANAPIAIEIRPEQNPIPTDTSHVLIATETSTDTLHNSYMTASATEEVRENEAQTVASTAQLPATPTTPSTPVLRRGSSRALKRARSRHFTADEDLTSSLMSRLFGVLLGPPSGLVAIMMQIARRLLASGPLASSAQAWRLGFRRAKTAKMPGRWVDSEDESVDDDYTDTAKGLSHATKSSSKSRAEHFDNDDDWDSLDEDDYGVPLANRQSNPLSLHSSHKGAYQRSRNVRATDTPESID